MTENKQTEFRKEGDPAFPAGNEEKDNSSDSSSDQTNTDQTQSQDGDQKSGVDNQDGGEDDKDKDNFADHPRWKEREDNWKKRFNEQEERHTQSLAELRQEFEQKLSGVKPASEAPAEVPSWFGGDEAQWKDFLKWNQGLVKEVGENIRKDIDAKTQAEQKLIDDATAYFNTQVTAIESDKDLNPNGLKVDRNKLLKFVLDNDVCDSKGNWNYKLAWQMMQSLPAKKKTEQINDKKTLAGATTSDNRGEKKPLPYATSDDFKQPGSRPW